MSIFIAKFTITIVVVIGLSEIAKRVNPNFAGILTGLPLGAGLSSYFFTYERGIPFMLEAVPWALAGLSSTVLFALTYLLAGRGLRIRPRIPAVAASVLVSTVVFALVVAILRSLVFNILGAVLICGIVIIFNIWVLRRVEVPSAGGPGRIIGFGVLIFRALTAGTAITIITGLAGILGPVWSGLVSAYPVMLFSLLVVLHFEEGGRLYPGVIQGYAYSVTNLVLFYLLLYFLLPRLGLNATFLIVYIVSALYLWRLNALRARSAAA